MLDKKLVFGCLETRKIHSYLSETPKHVQLNNLIFLQQAGQYLQSCLQFHGNFVCSSYKPELLLNLLVNFLRNSYELDMSFLQMSKGLRIKFLQTSFELLRNFLGTSQELLRNFLGTSQELLRNFLGTSYNLLTTFYEIFKNYLQSCKHYI